jgi:hypothetical protein
VTRDHDDILTAKTDRLRADSGNVMSDDPLVLFLYLLGRDTLPVGAVEAILGQIEVAKIAGTSVFTNGWLAEWATNAASRLIS